MDQNKTYKILTNFKEIELFNAINEIKKLNSFNSINPLVIYQRIIAELKNSDINDINTMNNNLDNIDYTNYDDIYFISNYRNGDLSEFTSLVNKIKGKLSENDNFTKYSRELFVKLEEEINNKIDNILNNNGSIDKEISSYKEIANTILLEDESLNSKYSSQYNELVNEGVVERNFEDPKNYKVYETKILNIIEGKKTYSAPSESSDKYIIIVGKTNSGDTPEPQPEAPDTIDVNGVTYYKVQPQSPGENYRLDTYHSPVYDIDYYAWIVNDEPQPVEEYTITFVTNNDTENTIITGPTGTPITAPSLEKSGYEFKGWSNTEQGTEPITIIIEIGTSNITYYAIWEQIETPETLYWYVGTTKPQSLNEASIVDSYQSETIYTNTSGDKSHIFVLTNNNKSVTFINTSFNEEVSQEPIDTTTIPGYNIFETSVGTAIDGNIKILVSDAEVIPEPTNTYYWYVGQTQPTDTSLATQVNTYASPVEYTNTGSRGYTYILLHNSKSISSIIGKATGGSVTFSIDNTVNIQNYNVYKTTAITNGSTIIITIA